MAYQATRTINFNHVEYGEGEPIVFGDGDAKTVAALLECGAIVGAADVVVEGSDEALLGAMTVVQLKEIAATREVALPEGAKKADIVAALIAAKADAEANE